MQCGFITSNKARWWGYSPDGVVLNNLTNTPIKLIEIKCPFKGKTLGSLDLLNCIKFVVKDTKGNWVIKKKHAYYAQVQLGMVMLNVTSCDFLIYSSFDDDYHLIPVELGIHFCKHLLLDLKLIFFEKLIHEICNPTL